MNHDVFFREINNAACNIFVEREDIVETKLKDNNTSVFFIDQVDRPIIIRFQIHDVVKSPLIGKLLWLDEGVSERFLYNNDFNPVSETNSVLFIDILANMVRQLVKFTDALNLKVDVEGFVKYVFQISATVNPAVLNKLSLLLLYDFWRHAIPHSKTSDVLDSKLYNRESGGLVLPVSEYKKHVQHPIGWVEKIFTP